MLLIIALVSSGNLPLSGQSLPRQCAFQLTLSKARFETDYSCNQSCFRIQGQTDLPVGTYLGVRLQSRCFPQKAIVKQGFWLRGSNFAVCLGPYQRHVLCDIYQVEVFFLPGYQNAAILRQTKELSFLNAQKDIAVGSAEQRRQESSYQYKLVAGYLARCQQLFRQARKQYQQLRSQQPDTRLAAWKTWYGDWQRVFDKLHQQQRQHAYSIFCPLFVAAENQLFTTLNILEDLVEAYGADLAGQEQPFARTDELSYRGAWQHNYRVLRFELLQRRPDLLPQEPHLLRDEIKSLFPATSPVDVAWPPRLAVFWRTVPSLVKWHIRRDLFLQLARLQQLYRKVTTARQNHQLANQWFRQLRQQLWQMRLALGRPPLKALPQGLVLARRLALQLLDHWHGASSTNTFKLSLHQVIQYYGLQNIAQESLRFHLHCLAQQFQILKQQGKETWSDREKWLQWQAELLKLQQYDRRIVSMLVPGQQLSGLRFQFHLLLARLIAMGELLSQGQAVKDWRKKWLADLKRLRQQVRQSP